MEKPKWTPGVGDRVRWIREVEITSIRGEEALVDEFGIRDWAALEELSPIPDPAGGEEE